MSSLVPVFLIVLVDVFGMTLVIPLLAIYAESFNATALQATLLVSVFAACQLISGPLIGRISDRTGRKPMLILSQIGTFIGFMILARATSLWMIYLSRIIDGATAGNLSLAQAYIADNTTPENRTKSFGLIGIAFGLGFFIGPSLTGFLAAKYGLAAPINPAAVMSATSILFSSTLLKGTRQTSTPDGDRWAAFRLGTYAQYFARPVLRGQLAQFLFYMLSFSMFISGFALFAERRYTWQGHPFGPREVGYIFGLIGFFGIILQGGFIGRLAKKYGEAGLVAAGFGAIVIGYLILGAATSIALLIVASLIAGFGNGVVRPSLTSLITHHAGRNEQGVVLGITQALTSTASIVAPVVTGLLIQHRLLSAWAWLAGLLALVGWILAAGARKMNPAEVIQNSEFKIQNEKLRGQEP